MVAPTQPPANAWVAFWRKVYNPLGFSKGYNFILFSHLGGALVGFTLARLQYLDIDNVMCGSGFSGTNRAAPGECFYYRYGSDRVFMLLHLATILPASLLVILQFTPAIRHKWILFHRLNGYLVILLSIVGTIAALLLARHAMGGTPALHAGVGVASVAFLFSLLMAYINIKRLQIEQHRAWMLRGWSAAASIVTIRPIMIISATILSRIGGFYQPFPCKVVEYLVAEVGPVNRTAQLFPACEDYMSGKNPDQWTVVEARLSDLDSPVPAAASLQLGFALAASIAFVIHLVGVELYLHLTPREAERLRRVSYRRQLEAGMRYPGRAGLTSDRLGDAERWEPREYGDDVVIPNEVATEPIGKTASVIKES